MAEPIIIVKDSARTFSARKKAARKTANERSAGNMHLIVKDSDGTEALNVFLSSVSFDPSKTPKARKEGKTTKFTWR